MSRELNAPGQLAASGTIPLAEPNLGERERAAVVDALDSGYVSSVGQAVDDFESAFADEVGARHAIACATGTAALHIALKLVGVTTGDEVLCSDFTFVGSANPIAYLGAAPVFVDSEEQTWNLDPEQVAQELHARAAEGRLPAAVEVVHVLGQPADLEPILEVCNEYAVPIVEDAAESLGAGWTTGVLAGRSTGAVGTVGAYSFNGNKIVTAGGGGMIVTDDAELARRARHLTTQAKVPDVGYLHDEVGYNYRLTNLAAALGGAQLSRLSEFVEAKRRIASRYDSALAGSPLVLPPRVPGFDSTYWLYSVLAHDAAQRDELLAFLGSRKIGARALWRPLHRQPVFEGRSRFLGGAIGDDLFARGVSLPCSTQLSDVDQDRVIAAVTEFFS